MATARQRLLQLALESLENKRKEIEAEIAALTRELLCGRGTRPAAAAAKLSAGRAGKRRTRFSKDERARRSARMKAYWDNWRKQKGRRK